MKNVIILIALLVLFKPLWPLAEYAVNYDYIVNELCENKDRPELQCNGKCYLTEQLGKEAAGEDENPFGSNSRKSEISQLFIIEDLPQFHLSYNLEFNPQKNLGYKSNLYTSLFISKILHPPRL